jgi:protein-L-isoaspartate(D-aspartate) O-methyltransferase
MRREPDHAAARKRMTERQLRARDIGDERVLAAMAEVPRELFVPDNLRRRAYDDGALPIGYDQTISQPWVVAAIAQALRLAGRERLLEIGTGSGYSTAVLARLAAEVTSLERVPELADTASERLRELGVQNAEVICADGSRGHDPGAPYDAIAIHAATPEVPHSLLGQLGEGGRLVAPIATSNSDLLTVFRLEAHGLRQETIGPCRFVPLIGAEGFDAPG